MVETTMPLAKIQPPQSYGRRVLKRFLKHRAAVAGLAFLVLLSLTIIGIERALLGWIPKEKK